MGPRMVAAAAVLAFAACGRIGFDGHMPGAGNDAGVPDGAGSGDAQPLACVPPPCASTATVMMCGNRCFGFCREQLVFADARTRCEAWSGTLASIHDNTEQTCLRELIGSTGGWFGYVQSAAAPTAASSWSWLDGTSSSYTHWFTAEPNDEDDVEDGDEQCGALFGGGGWNDDHCTYQHAFLCAR